MSDNCRDRRCGCESCATCHPELQATTRCCVCGEYVELFRVSGVTCVNCGGEVCEECVALLVDTGVGNMCPDCNTGMMKGYP